MNAVTTSARSSRDYSTGAEAFELRAFFTGHEAAIGFKSTFGSMLAALNGLCSGGGSADFDPLAEMLDRAHVSRGHATWRTLRALDRQGDAGVLVILHRLYGYIRIPGEYFGKNAFGDDGGAQLASLTDAAEHAREKLAVTRGTERESGVFLRAEAAHADSRTELARQFWDAVRREERVVSRLERLVARMTVDPSDDALHNRAADCYDLADAWRTVQRNALRAYQVDGRLAARLSCLAGADRETTIEQAIAARLEDSNVPRRTEFVTAVRLDASKLKRSAHDAYRAAKRAAA